MISPYDKMIVGLLTALVVTFVAYGFLLQVGDWISSIKPSFSSFTERSIALLAICFNVLPMNYFRRNYHHKALRGLVVGTMALALTWFVVYGQQLLNG